MQTITFDTEFATKLEQVICLEFGCGVSEIVSLRDSLFKKVIVYFLVKNKNYNARVISAFYQISYLYVPTVVAEIENLIKNVPAFDEKIQGVRKKIDFES